MVGQRRTGSREGGVEVVVTELAARLAALGHEVTCYDRSCRGADGSPAPSAPWRLGGVRVVPVPTVDARGLAALTSAFSATRAALRDRPDVVHYHAEGPCNALPLAARAGVATVATIHGLDWQRAKWGPLASRAIRRGEAAAARRADGLVVLSEPARRYFLDEYGREAAVVPNGVEPRPSRPARLVRERWGLEPGSYALFVGRLVPEKRPELLLEAWRGLRTGRRLVLAGGPGGAPAFRERVLALAARDPRVVAAGFAEGELLDELYSNAWCYVLPSDVEGMPMALLEAMSHGLCCVTSDAPELAAALGGAGAVFPRGDAAALRGELASLMAEPARAAALGEAARARALSEFGWDRAVARTVEVYEGALR